MATKGFAIPSLPFYAKYITMYYATNSKGNQFLYAFSFNFRANAAVTSAQCRAAMASKVG